MLQAICFDLDGTLLPMDNDHFTQVYFQHLAATAAQWGVHRLPDADQSGVGRRGGHGKKPGRVLQLRRLFWSTFGAIMGQKTA